MTARGRTKLVKRIFGKAVNPEAMDTEAHFEYLQGADDVLEMILQELDEFISGDGSRTYSLSVIHLPGLHPPLLKLSGADRNYAPDFDERIFTEKLLGKPALGPSPPNGLPVSLYYN